MDVVARRLGPKDEMIANVLFDEAVAVVAADHGIGQVHVFDHSLQLASVVFADPAAEDHGDLVRLTDRSVGIEHPLSEVVERGAAMKDEIVAKLDLREEQPMLTARFLSLFRSEERRQPRQPFLTASQ